MQLEQLHEEVKEQDFKLRLMNFVLQRTIQLGEEVNKGNAMLITYAQEYQSNLFGLDEFNKKLQVLDVEQHKLKGKMELLLEINDKLLG
jgi:hypothetical protein